MNATPFARQPWQVDPATRRLVTVAPLTHLDDLVRLVILTDPGERLHRPGFGAGLGPATLFEPLTGDVTGAVTARLHGTLSDALGDRLVVVDVSVTVADSTVAAHLTYRPLPSGDERTVLLELPVPGGAT